jgi:hypothetical protein
MPPKKEIEMSAITVSVPHSHRSIDRPWTTTATPPYTIVQPTATPADWRLTDRGIAVVMVLAAMILTSALVVIGLTAVRVTSADYGADVRELRHSQH